MALVAVSCPAAGTSVCRGSLVVGLLGYTLLCLRRFTRCACTGIPLGSLAPAGALACVLWCGVPLVFFRVALGVWGPSSPCCFHRPRLSHGAPVLCLRGMTTGVLPYWRWCGCCFVFLVRCAQRLPIHVWFRSATCNILGSAAGIFSWRLLHAVLLFGVSFRCWGAHKSVGPIACTL